MFRRALYVLVTCFSLACLASASNQEFDKEARFPLQEGSRLRLSIPVGELRVTGTTEAAISIRLHVNVKRGSASELEKRLKIRLQPGGEVRLVIDGLEEANHCWWKSVEARAEVLVPAKTHLNANVGVGELRVEGVTGDLRGHVGVGEIRLEVADPALYRSVRAHTGIGEVRHPFQGKSHGWLGKSFSGGYDRGLYRLDASVGVGEVRISEPKVI